MSSDDLLGFLASAFTEPVRDPLWGNIFLSPALEALASAPSFSALAGIKQLGPAYLVYPGATHTRKAHSFGVFHLARRTAWALAARGDLSFVSREGLSSFLVAALCHDLGHFPFAHSLKELALERHEVLSARMVENEPLRSLIGKAKADPDAIAAIIDESRPDRGERQIRFFRRLLSGVLDPDKLDYLCRDAFFCGVPYGDQDIDFILQRISIGPDDELGVDERGLMSVEGILFSKYLMYRSVYWHKGVRAATAMIKKAVFLALEAGLLAPESLYGLDDAGFFSLLSSLRFEAIALARSVLQGAVFRTVFELPFDARDERHTALLDLASRTAFEERLAAKADDHLAPLDVIVDIPESVSFEAELPVLVDSVMPHAAEYVPFSESGSAFSPTVVEDLQRSLRRIRVFCPRFSEGLKEAAMEALA
jgi:HD superfamily phosphohydrolase